MTSAVWRGLFGVGTGLFLTACGSVPNSAPRTATTWVAERPATQVLDRLYFGRKIPGGGEVSDDDWTRFVAEVVTPRFPAGITIFHARGQWRGDDGRIGQEPTMIIEIAHADDATSTRSIEAIATEYKRRFVQEAVLRIRQAAGVTFF